MHSIRQKCRPKHQVLILKCYPRTIKGAVDVKPNSSELSYLLYYATTRRSKVQKVGAFLEKKTASDVWRARIGNVQITLQILAAFIEKAPRDLPLYAPYVLKILSIILRSRDITMVESSIPTFEAFCEHHDGSSLVADQEYLGQYEDIVKTYASFASTRIPEEKPNTSAPVAMRWRNVGLEAIQSVASSEALASIAGRQLNVIVPVLLQNIWADDEDFIDMLAHRAQMEENADPRRVLGRRASNATVRTVETSTDAGALSATTADADKLAEEHSGVLALRCLKQIFEVNNRSQIHGATAATLAFITDRIAHHEPVIDEKPREGKYGGWATKVFEMIAQWTPVQDRYVILVTAMDTLVRGQLNNENLYQHLVLATMVDSLLKSDTNLIGLSVMDVLLGLISHVLRVLQLGGATPHLQQENGSGLLAPPSTTEPESALIPTDTRRDLLERLQQCIGNLATHVYYADQISDIVSAILLRLKPTSTSGLSNLSANIENPNVASATVTTATGDLTEDLNTDGFFSFDTAKIKALEAVKAVLLVGGHRNNVGGASLGRNRVPLRVWEGTQWLLRDGDGRVRKAYVDALLVWLDTEATYADLRVFEETAKNLTKSGRNDSATNLTKRAVSNASQREKPVKHARTTFLQLLHLAIYENALQFVDSEADIVLLHLLLTQLVHNLGVNAVKNGLPMIFRLQEEILEAETPISKIRIGSLCHGYFWLLSERFDFDSSPTGQTIHNEIYRRQKKGFWVDRIRLPPLPLEQIDLPGTITPLQALPLEELESESLTPFDDRFQMVKLISLSYAESVVSPPTSPSLSPGRTLSQGIIQTSRSAGPDRTMPEAIREEMMSEWSKESVLALIQESSRSISLNGSKTGTNATGPRNFLAVNGMATTGSNSGSQSPQGHHHTHRSGVNPAYGLVGSVGVLTKLRKGSAHSPSPASDSSRNSVTRVDQLKRVLSGQLEGPGPRRVTIAHSDASSESMVSYDFTASEVSFSPGQQNVPPMERSASLRGPNERARSKSRDRVASQALTSNPVSGAADLNTQPAEEEDLDAVPPVPPLPSSLTGETVSVHDHASPGTVRKSKRNTASGALWGDNAPSVDLESLLNGIDTSGEQKGNVAMPPY